MIKYCIALQMASLTVACSDQRSLHGSPHHTSVWAITTRGEIFIHEPEGEDSNGEPSSQMYGFYNGEINSYIHRELVSSHPHLPPTLSADSVVFISLVFMTRSQHHCSLIGIWSYIGLKLLENCRGNTCIWQFWIQKSCSLLFLIFFDIYFYCFYTLLFYIYNIQISHEY